MLDRLTLCAEICRLVHMSRTNPRAEDLSRTEMMQVFTHLVAITHRLTQLEAEVQHLQRLHPDGQEENL